MSPLCDVCLGRRTDKRDAIHEMNNQLHANLININHKSNVQLIVNAYLVRTSKSQELRNFKENF